MSIGARHRAPQRGRQCNVVCICEVTCGTNGIHGARRDPAFSRNLYSGQWQRHDRGSGGYERSSHLCAADSSTRWHDRGTQHHGTGAGQWRRYGIATRRSHQLCVRPSDRRGCELRSDGADSTGRRRLQHRRRFRDDGVGRRHRSARAHRSRTGARECNRHGDSSPKRDDIYVYSNRRDGRLIQRYRATAAGGSHPAAAPLGLSMDRAQAHCFQRHSDWRSMQRTTSM